MKFLTSLTLKQCLIFFISSMLIITTIIMLFIPAFLFRNLYQKQTEEQCQAIAKQVSISLVNTLHNFDTKLDQMVEDPELRSLVFQNKENPSSSETYKTVIESYFSIDAVDTSYLRSIDLYIKSDNKCFQSDITKPIIDNAFESTYYKQALICPNNLNWIDYNQELDCIEVSRVIYDNNTYVAEGMLLIRLTPAFLYDNFTIHNNLTVNGVYITDGYGKIFSSKNHEALGKNLNDLSITLPVSLSSSGTLHLDDQMFVFCKLDTVSYLYPYEKWAITIGIDKDALLEDFNSILFLFVVIAIIILIIGVSTTILFSRFLSKPIIELSNAMSEIPHENLKIALTENSSVKEINSANKGFNKMSRQLDTLINKVYKSQLAQKEAQLKTLQDQMNPHFLFNTLQLISLKAHEYEAYSVCEMIYSLSYMLEADLCSENYSTFTLREELKYIEQYANIIRYKYEGKIEIFTEVPKELFNCRIPKILLQPFIENSVVHGLAPKPTPGCVTLKVSEQNRNLCAVIQDDGIGIRPEILDKISEDCSAVDHDFKSTDSHHIALQNIRNRIKLLYGEQYGFTIQSEFLIGTSITLQIPLQYDEDIEKGEQNE